MWERICRKGRWIRRHFCFDHVDCGFICVFWIFPLLEYYLASKRVEENHQQTSIIKIFDAQLKIHWPKD